MYSLFQIILLATKKNLNQCLHYRIIVHGIFHFSGQSGCTSLLENVEEKEWISLNIFKVHFGDNLRYFL